MSTIYTDPPQSRNEAIIKSTIDGIQYTDPPQSRMEDLLLELKEAIEGGGGGGTTVVANPEGEATDELEKLQVGSDIYGIPKDYAELDNKPSINDVELSGNKTASELGLQPTLDGAQTVSGNPITVTDAEAMNAESVVVELEPKQDLHGYDAPWVGGSGKNLLPMTVDWIKTHNTEGTWSGNTCSINNGTVEILTDGNSNVVGLKVNGTFSTNIFLQLSDENEGGFDFLSLNMPYIINGGVRGIGVRAYHYDGSNTASSYGSDAPFTLTSYPVGGNIDAAILHNVTFDDVIIRPMIRLATETDPTFAPYSNICPITGYSEVNVERVGKNLFDKNQTFTFNGFISSDGTLTSSIIWWTTDYQLIKSGTYTLSGVLDGASAYYGICWYDENKNFIDGFQRFTTESASVNIPNNAKYIRYSVNEEAFNTFQLELGNQATTYEPYQGTTYTIDLDGTKYGGTLDVTEGGFIDDHGYATINYASLVDGLFRVQAPSDVNWSYPSCKCSCLEVLDTVDDLADNYGISYDDGYFYMNLPPECGATESAVQTWLQNNPIDVVYVTRDVTEVSTTPTDITLLENTNNISTDGTNITLKYQPNNVIGECKAYTDEQCAKVLPPLPTTDGTYHLSCEVTSGVGVLSWVSDS